MVLTDHSPRLTIAHGLNAERLREQLSEIAYLNERIAPFRVLTGMEVDILEDGALDLADELLAELDVVVASVHSKLSMDRQSMTRRMVMAMANPHVDILGHCTGRKLRSTVSQVASDPEVVRPESQFDPEIVFAACARFDTAVEINCRPERQDPPDRLLELALEWECKVSIDTDAHAPGQLEWQNSHGCAQGRSRHDIEADRGHRQHVLGRRAGRMGCAPSPHPPRIGSPGYVEEDRQAQDQRPSQEGEPRAQAQRGSGLSAPTPSSASPANIPCAHRLRARRDDLVDVLHGVAVADPYFAASRTATIRRPGPVGRAPRTP